MVGPSAVSVISLMCEVHETAPGTRAVSQTPCHTAGPLCHCFGGQTVRTRESLLSAIDASMFSGKSRTERLEEQIRQRHAAEALAAANAAAEAKKLLLQRRPSSGGSSAGSGRSSPVSGDESHRPIPVDDPFWQQPKGAP